MSQELKSEPGQSASPTLVHPGGNPYQNQTSSYPSVVTPYHPQYSASYPPRFEEEEGPGPFLRGMSLVAFGGFVGLTAAAAARWLNGGDFEIFPSPPPPPVVFVGVPRKEVSTRERQIQEGQLLDAEDPHGMRGGLDHPEDIMGEEEDVEDDDDEEEEYIKEEAVVYVTEIPERLMEQVESIAETMKIHVSVQEKILQKLLSTNNGSTITNQSMELLRASSDVAPTNSRRGNASNHPSSEVLQLWAELLQIKGELRTLQDVQRQNSPSDKDHISVDDRVDATLSKLDSCIESIGEMFATSQSSSTPARAELLSSSDISCSAPTTDPTLSSSTTAPITAPIPKDPISTTTTRSSIGHLTVRQSISKMAQTADPVKLRVACQLLYLYLVNLVGAPKNPRYRKIFTGNENFKKVDAVEGAKSLLLAVGFVEESGTGCLEWLVGTRSSSTTTAAAGDDNGDDEDDEGEALRRVQEVLPALSILKTGQPSSSPELEAHALAVLSMESDTVVPGPSSNENVEQEKNQRYLQDQEPPRATTSPTAGHDEPTNVVHDGPMGGDVPLLVPPQEPTESTTENAQKEMPSSSADPSESKETRD